TLANAIEDTRSPPDAAIQTASKTATPLFRIASASSTSSQCVRERVQRIGECVTEVCNLAPAGERGGRMASGTDRAAPGACGGRPLFRRQIAGYSKGQLRHAYEN